MLSLGTSTLVSKTILASQKDAGSVVAFHEKPAAHNPLVDGEKNPIASEQKYGLVPRCALGRLSASQSF
ncbi:hypothetical protein CEXT_26161 [Caerostris extrusa]|uniref:Uncharacterized protein n=1 Tax=Caerostris extrusa TaxID=172846 RepID=A0AAV4Q5G9_CAEEX|nr:hypothetical protein CEXT_26161 [Caerostris extrusa]